jgi:hypothetical protein
MTWKFKGNTTKPGNPLWNEYEDDETGEKTLQEHKPSKVSSFDSCKHYYELIDSLGNVQCHKCGLGTRIVWGIYKLQNGQIVKMKSQRQVIKRKRK